jgi:ABC-2 type transport system ATP-binding protein
MTLIQADHLYRYFGDHCAVKDVSFTLEKGEVLGFLGPNGAGKTTTMQMLCGLLAPSSGQIRINNIDLLDEPKLAKQSLGFLPDLPPLYQELSVQEFLDYCARLHLLTGHAITKAVNYAMTRCGLSAVRQRMIGNLSKGFQQRVGIAQAILHNPEIIILDEPTVGLDPLQIREIRDLIKELGQNHGIILSTHILPEIQETCSHVQVIHQGQLVLKETIAGLTHLMKNESLAIKTQYPVDLSKLTQIPGIEHIDLSSENQLTVHHNAAHNPASQLAEIIINAGWGLLELSPVKKSMEEIFINLTIRENNKPCD